MRILISILFLTAHPKIISAAFSPARSILRCFTSIPYFFKRSSAISFNKFSLYQFLYWRRLLMHKTYGEW
jgi:hypothetical protein